MDPAKLSDFFPLLEASIIVTERSSTSVTVEFRGELDTDNMAEVESVLSGLLPEKGDVFADLAGVTFLGSSGIRALVQVYNECETRGVRFHVRNPAPMSRRVLEISGLTEAFDVPPGPPAPEPRLVDVLFRART
ncbi:hypothetical protein Ari01nite_50410 [Paractinoplanes rishiriensis]|uniref:Anti-sigma factor antagonist n=2 Tax=Paractinoplanes rishiriensis TaxID=1050105 RepID=A0A919JYI4_9ACTN|nr:hypothetical protein Ari01nite_50410 [Actinoplanes rishiriensis]